MTRCVATLDDWELPDDDRELRQIATDPTGDWRRVFLNTLADALDKIGHPEKTARS
ncbi:hypothetical protein [Bradyrhizobium sp. UFLA05-112]